MMEINKIYNENCLDTMARMPNNFIDLTVTSPPYDNLRTYNDKIDKTWNEDVWQLIIKELFRITKEGGVVVWVVGDATINGSETGTSFKQALFFMQCGFRLHDTMIYLKDKSVFPEKIRYGQIFEYMFVFSKYKPKTHNLIKDRKNKYLKVNSGTERLKNGETLRQNSINLKEYGNRDNVWLYSTGYQKSAKDFIAYEHPAIMPEKLAADHIASWSNKGDLIYDPFMGSGTTAKMAYLQNRNYIGSEISSEYIKIAEKRLKPYLTQTRLF